MLEDMTGGGCVVGAGIASPVRSNATEGGSSSVGRSYPLKIVSDVGIKEEMVSPSRSAPIMFRDSVATLVMVILAPESFSFPEKDSLYALY